MKKTFYSTFFLYCFAVFSIKAQPIEIKDIRLLSGDWHVTQLFQAGEYEAAYLNDLGDVTNKLLTFGINDEKQFVLYFHDILPYKERMGKDFKVVQHGQIIDFDNDNSDDDNSMDIRLYAPDVEWNSDSEPIDKRNIFTMTEKILLLENKNIVFLDRFNKKIAILQKKADSPNNDLDVDFFAGRWTFEPNGVLRRRPFGELEIHPFGYIKGYADGQAVKGLFDYRSSKASFILQYQDRQLKYYVNYFSDQFLQLDLEPIVINMPQYSTQYGHDLRTIAVCNQFRDTTIATNKAIVPDFIYNYDEDYNNIKGYLNHKVTEYISTKQGLKLQFCNNLYAEETDSCVRILHRPHRKIKSACDQITNIKYDVQWEVRRFEQPLATVIRKRYAFVPNIEQYIAKDGTLQQVEDSICFTYINMPDVMKRDTTQKLHRFAFAPYICWDGIERCLYYRYYFIQDGATIEVTEYNDEKIGTLHSFEYLFLPANLPFYYDYCDYGFIPNNISMYDLWEMMNNIKVLKKKRRFK